MTPRCWFALAMLFVAGVISSDLNAVGGRQSSPAAQLASAAKSLPDYLHLAKDPAFGTIFVRITKPGVLAEGIVCSKTYCSHRYSSSQAWNADQSLLVIGNGCHGMCFLDGHTYVPLFHRDRLDECEWHPRDPRLMICVAGRAIFTWAPRTDM